MISDNIEMCLGQCAYFTEKITLKNLKSISTVPWALVFLL